MKAIETIYKGYRFRSRLEAKWAVFFDAIGIKWEYEKEGFELKSGRYLPDFFLPEVSLRGEDVGVWFEIKGSKYTDEENTLCEELGEFTKHPVVIAVGLPEPDGEKDTMHQIYPWGDNCMLFMKCANEKCGHVKIEFWEGNYYYCNKCNSDAYEVPGSAIEAARSARFEFGESGGVR